MARRWYWPVGVVALGLVLYSGWLRGGSEDGSFAFFVAGVVVGTIFELGRRTDRDRSARDDRDGDDETSPSR